ncbi:MAG: MG2 domain-containing protein, partial [Bacteroidota bacterium]
MKNKAMKKKNLISKALTSAIILAAVLGVIPIIKASGYFTQEVENDFIRKAKNIFDAFHEKLPEDRVYMQFDKPFYKPGETIWFAAYVRNGKDFSPSKKSEILHAQLISPKGMVEKDIKLICKNGKTVGDFSIAQEAQGGLYKIKAFTNWQKNEPDTVFFEKEITVQDIVLPNLKMKLDFERKAFGAGDEVLAKLELNTNENIPLANYSFKYVESIEGKSILELNSVTGNDGIMYIRFKLPGNLKTNDGLLNVMINYQGQTESVSRSIPIVLNKIRLNLFPEGGDLVSGLESKVGFRALNEFGKPSDIEGDVFDENDHAITHFTSYHQGMGSFNLKPESGKNYYAKISKPENIKEHYSLPEPLPRGYVLSTCSVNPSEITVTINSSETEELNLVAQTRGKIFYATTLNAIAGANKLIIPSSSFPIGVSQFTLFDSKGIERAERLVFLNKNKQLHIIVETDKEKYSPREKVKMKITVMDDRGMPMPAGLSLAVVNDELLSFADDKSGNILSTMLLENDIKGKIEDPVFYFNAKETKADIALDYLLMTAGWRHFTWKKILDNEIPNALYQGEKTIVSGIVLDQNSNHPINNAKIKIGGKDRTITVNEKGEFSFEKLDLSTATNLTILADGYTTQTIAVNDYNQNIKYYLNDGKRLVYDEDIPMKRAERINIEQQGAIALEGWNNKDKIALVPAASPKNKQTPARHKQAVHFNNAKVEQKPNEDNGDVPDELMANIGFARNDNMKKERKMAQIGGKRFMAGDEEQNFQNLNEEVEKVPNVGYYRAKEFAAPIYDKPQSDVIRNDFRSTVYWNGDVVIDRTGKGFIEFYNSDDISSFRATVEGISQDGMIGRAEKNFYTQLPFAMTVKAPLEVVTEDKVSIALTLKNNTRNTITGILNVKTPSALKEINPIASTQSLSPGQVKVIYLDYQVMNAIGEGDLNISFNSFGLNDAFIQKIKIVSKGFPVTLSFSGKVLSKEYQINLSNIVDGSISAQVTAFPSVVSDLMKGVEGILREPSGCFEQTSISSYPNIMVMDYLKSIDDKDEKLLASAGKLIDVGYKKLTSFETKEKGYEWFGGSPAHEALTAYGLMQFNDMKAVYNNVDQKMIDRTAEWLITRRDGNGGFKRNPRALDNFGGASEDITNAYIVYALTESGNKDLDKEINVAYKKAIDNKDPYQLAL